MEIAKVTKIWEELHKKDTGELGFCDLDKAIENVEGQTRVDYTKVAPKLLKALQELVWAVDSHEKAVIDQGMAYAESIMAKVESK